MSEKPRTLEYGGKKYVVHHGKCTDCCFYNNDSSILCPCTLEDGYCWEEAPRQKAPNQEVKQSNSDKFWLLWNPKGHLPAYKHQWFDEAAIEAERLARKCGEPIYLLECVAVAKLVDKPVKIVKV